MVIIYLNVDFWYINPTSVFFIFKLKFFYLNFRWKIIYTRYTLLGLLLTVSHDTQEN